MTSRFFFQKQLPSLFFLCVFPVHLTTFKLILNWFCFHWFCSVISNEGLNLVSIHIKIKFTQYNLYNRDLLMVPYLRYPSGFSSWLLPRQFLLHPPSVLQFLSWPSFCHWFSCISSRGDSRPAPISKPFGDCIGSRLPLLPFPQSYRSKKAS